MVIDTERWGGRGNKECMSAGGDGTSPGTCILLAWVLLGDAGGRRLRKLELLHHLGGQETHGRTVNEHTHTHRVKCFYKIKSAKCGAAPKKLSKKMLRNHF